VAEPLPPIFLATAVESVIRAGDVQMAHFGGDLHVDKKGAIDLVTDIDLRVEREFRARIAARFPDHVVLGEEFSSPAERDVVPEYCWVFDPVELEIRGVPSVAAVYDPSRRELFTAERGAGAWLNGAPLRVSGATALIDSLLCTGFPYSVQRSADDLVRVFAEFLKVSRAVRRLGSAAIDLCYVAAGRFDGFWEHALHPWDVAAGALIVEEAGGRVTNLSGGPYSSREGSVIATNGLIHDAMVKTIASATSGDGLTTP
jgi:myo-inositol-1(or 4)-monophosphatase